MVMNDENGDANDVVIVLEATANTVAHWDPIKKLYLIPAINHFCKRSQGNGDLLSSSDGNQYGLVLFHAADRMPLSSTQCFQPTNSAHLFLKMLDTIQFDGGGGEHFSHVTEGLATALQLFQDLKHPRSDCNVNRFCILVSSTPPYSMPCVESLEYAGCTGQDICDKMKEQSIKMSVVSPRHILLLQQIFTRCHSGQPPLMNYALDRRHLVLISGFQLPSEKEPVPVNKNTEEESAAVFTGNAVTPMEVTVSSAASFPPPIPMETTSGVSTQPHVQKPSPIPSNGPSIPAPAYSIVNPATSLPNPIPIPAGSDVVVKTEYTKPSMVPVVPRPIEPPVNSQPVVRPPMHVNQPPQASNSPYAAAKEQAKIVLQIAAQNGIGTAQIPQSTPPEVKPMWTGTLEWTEKRKTPDGLNTQRIPHSIPCQMIPQRLTSELNTNAWPPKLSMQIIPQMLISQVQAQLRQMQSSYVLFQFPMNEMFSTLVSNMQKDMCGLIQVNPNTPGPNGNESKLLIIILKRKDDKHQVMGLIPSDFVAVMTAIRNAAAITKQHQAQQQQKLQQQQQQQQQQDIKPQMAKLISQTSTHPQMSVGLNMNSQNARLATGMSSTVSGMVPSHSNTSVNLPSYGQQPRAPFQRTPGYQQQSINQPNIQMGVQSSTSRMSQIPLQSGLQQPPTRMISVNSAPRQRFMQPRTMGTRTSNMPVGTANMQAQSMQRNMVPLSVNISSNPNRIRLQQLQNHNTGITNRPAMHEQPQLRHLLRNDGNMPQMGINVRTQGNPVMRQSAPQQITSNFVVRGNTMQRMPNQRPF